MQVTHDCEEFVTWLASEALTHAVIVSVDIPDLPGIVKHLPYRKLLRTLMNKIYNVVPERGIGLVVDNQQAFLCPPRKKCCTTTLLCLHRVGV